MIRMQPNGREATLRINGETLCADLDGSLWWPGRRTLIVADLHLEKGSAYARRGQLLPPYDSAATLARLADAIGRRDPDRVVCLGDSFHDRDADGRLDEGCRGRLAALMAGRQWLWLTGNHDPAPPAGLGGQAGAELTEGGLSLRHEARQGPSASLSGGEISGHYHPKASVRVRYHRLSGRCFVFDQRRLVLPAFGAYAGGLDVRDRAIAGLMARNHAVLLLGRNRLHLVSAARLGRDEPVAESYEEGAFGVGTRHGGLPGP